MIQGYADQILEHEVGSIPEGWKIFIWKSESFYYLKQLYFLPKVEMLVTSKVNLGKKVGTYERILGRTSEVGSIPERWKIFIAKS